MHWFAAHFHIDSPEVFRGLMRWLFKTLAFLILSGAALLIAAGQWYWGLGWLYLSILVFIQVCTVAALLPSHPDLIVERSKLREGTKRWDFILSNMVALFGPVTTWVVAGLDHRFRWSAEVSPWVIGLGIGMTLAGGLFTLWAMLHNRFFAATVRIQTERGQVVEDEGPYALMRHPGYLGGLVFNLATPFALASEWAFAPALVTCALLVLRTYLEDQTLQKELKGYREYTRRVPHRLIPGIW